MSDQTTPEMAPGSCTGAGSRQTLCCTAGSHSGRPAGLPLKSARSVSPGRRASISPPPSTSTALLTGEPGSAAALTLTATVMSAAPAAPAAITVLLLQSKRLSPTAPLQAQPAPMGSAASVRPTGRRSLTV